MSFILSAAFYRIAQKVDPIILDCQVSLTLTPEETVLVLDATTAKVAWKAWCYQTRIAEAAEGLGVAQSVSLLLQGHPFDPAACSSIQKVRHRS